jgi:hypothetical protein
MKDFFRCSMVVPVVVINHGLFKRHSFSYFTRDRLTSVRHSAFGLQYLEYGSGLEIFWVSSVNSQPILFKTHEQTHTNDTHTHINDAQVSFFALKEDRKLDCKLLFVFGQGRLLHSRRITHNGDNIR